MDYIKNIENIFKKSKDDDPVKYSENLSNSISYIKENVIDTFLRTNKQSISEITNQCNSNYVYRSMSDYAVDTRSFLDDFRNNHMFNLLEFVDATYEIENDDIMLESVQGKLDVVKKANTKAKETAIKKHTKSIKLGNIIDNIYTLLEFCEGNSCYSFYEDTIKNIKNKKFHGIGDYEKSQKEYACLVLETCADAISSGLSQSINSLLTAYNLCKKDEKEIMNDRNKPEFQLF